MSSVLHVARANDDRVLVLTLDRPAARNAVDIDMARQLAAALDELDEDTRLRAAVLTGAGGSFCAGMDLKAFADGQLPFLPGRGFAGFTQAPPRKPMIAAVEGYALAGGFEVALACDLIVAAEDAKLGLPEVRRGLIAAGGGLLRLPRHLPHAVASEIALLGEPIGAPRLHQLGLVNRIVPPGSSLAVAVELASAIADNAPLAVQVSKVVLDKSPEWGLTAGWAEQEPYALKVLGSEDALDGARAFAERRSPVWSGQ